MKLEKEIVETRNYYENLEFPARMLQAILKLLVLLWAKMSCTVLPSVTNLVPMLSSTGYTPKFGILFSNKDSYLNHIRINLVSCSSYLGIFCLAPQLLFLFVVLNLMFSLMQDNSVECFRRACKIFSLDSEQVMCSMRKLLPTCTRYAFSLCLLCVTDDISDIYSCNNKLYWCFWFYSCAFGIFLAKQPCFSKMM